MASRNRAMPRKANDQLSCGVSVIFVVAVVAGAIFLSLSPDVCAAAGSSNVAAAHRLELSGSIKDALGRPIAGAEVRLEEGGRVIARSRTDSAGAFLFKSLPPGTYVVIANQQGFKQTAQVVAVTSKMHGGPVPVTMEAEAPLTLQLAAARLDRARNDLSTEVGSTAYRFDQEAIHRLPEGQNSALAQVLQQAPGVSQDSYGQGQDQIHIHGENGGGIQYRINDVFIPQAVTSFGEIFSPRFVRSLTLLTGVLPAEVGFRTEGIVDIHTKDGCVDGGAANDNVEIYGGQRDTLEPSFEVGGCEGRFSYYVSGFYLRNNLGLQAPDDSPDPNHDHTEQGQGFAYLSWLLNSDTRLSILTGTAVNSFEIPPEPGLAQQFTLAGVPNYPSSEVKENELEQNYYGVMALQGTLDGSVNYQVAAFSRYYQLKFNPDPVGDLIYNGVAAKILHTGFVNGVQNDTSYQLDSHHTLRAGFYMSGEAIELDDHAETFPATGGVQSGTMPISIVDDNNQIAWLLGFYAQDEWRPLPKLTINFGLRWDWMSAFVTQNQWSPRFAVEYALTRSTTLHAGYARYFEVPPFDQVALETVQKFANTTNAAPVNSGNDKIEAERDDYFDAGIRQRVVEGLNLGVDGFYKIGHDQLDLAQLSGTVVTAPLNYRESRAWGSDFSLTFERNGLSAYLNFSYAVLQAQHISAGAFLADSAAEISYIANHWVTLDDDQMFVGSGGASYEIWGYLLTADGIWGSGYRRGFANTGELPPIIQFNAAIVRSIRLPRIGNVEGRVSLINVFDHTYQIRNGTGIGVFSPSYGPRRALYAGIKIPLAPILTGSP
jgi:outer membrane receptor protein involved in Fe transport